MQRLKKQTLLTDTTMERITTKKVSRTEVNNTVYVSLTEKGWELLRNNASKICDGDEERIEEYMKVVYKDKRVVIGNGVYNPFLLWEFMSIFGPHLYHGMNSSNALFETDKIYIEHE